MHVMYIHNNSLILCMSVHMYIVRSFKVVVLANDITSKPRSTLYFPQRSPHVVCICPQMFPAIYYPLPKLVADHTHACTHTHTHMHTHTHVLSPTWPVVAHKLSHCGSRQLHKCIVYVPHNTCIMVTTKGR